MQRRCSQRGACERHQRACVNFHCRERQRRVDVARGGRSDLLRPAITALGLGIRELGLVEGLDVFVAELM